MLAHRPVLESARTGYRVALCLAVLGFTAAMLPAQVEDLLERLLGGGQRGRIESVEAVGDAIGETVLRVTYTELENPQGVKISARLLDFRLRSLDGFSIDSAAAEAPSGTAELRVVYAGSGSATSSSVEVRLERGDQVLAKKAVPLARVWRAQPGGEDEHAASMSGSGTGGGQPAGSDTSLLEPEITEVVIDPIPMPNTPTGEGPPASAEDTSTAGGASAGGGASVGTPPPMGRAGSTVFEARPLKTKILVGILAPQIGYLWANQQTSSRYTPPATYAYNSGGGNVSVVRSNVGSYGVQYDRLGAGASKGGSLQVTSYGAGADRCQVNSWNTHSAGFQGAVRCTDQAGRPADRQFTTLFALGLGASKIGYVLVEDSTNRAYSLTERYVANAGGSPVAVTRNSQGSFTVRFPGLGSADNRGNLQVTSKGTSGEHCKLGGWSFSAGALVANVRCFSALGQLVDSRFSLLAVVGDRADKSTAYTQASPPGDGSQTPPSVVSQAPAGARVDRSRTGVYSVRFGGLEGDRGGTVQVTAVGLDSNWCKVAKWDASSGGLSAGVLCFRADGQPADSGFSILVVR